MWVWGGGVVCVVSWFGLDNDTVCAGILLNDVTQNKTRVRMKIRSLMREIFRITIFFLFRHLLATSARCQDEMRLLVWTGSFPLHYVVHNFSKDCNGKIELYHSLKVVDKDVGDFSLFLILGHL